MDPAELVPHAIPTDKGNRPCHWNIFCSIL